MPRTRSSRITNATPPPTRRRYSNVWRSVPGPRGGRARLVVLPGLSARSSKKDTERSSQPSQRGRLWGGSITLRAGVIRSSRPPGQGGSHPLGPNTGSDVERPPTTEELRTARLDDGRPPAMEADSGRRFGAPRGDRHRLVLDRYRLERRLGAGGFGVVWLAFDEKLEREVAVKVVEREGDGPVPERTVREARVAARLNHPGIVALYELGEDEDAVYQVPELVPGRTLAELTHAGAISDRDVARIRAALC